MTVAASNTATLTDSALARRERERGAFDQRAVVIDNGRPAHEPARNSAQRQRRVT